MHSSPNTTPLQHQTCHHTITVIIITTQRQMVSSSDSGPNIRRSLLSVPSPLLLLSLVCSALSCANPQIMSSVYRVFS